MKFITITLIVHAPDPFTGAQKSTRDRFREVLDSALPAVLRREIPDPPWGWGGGPLADDAVPPSTSSSADPAAVSPVATTG